METINKIELTDKRVYPDEKVLLRVLDNSYKLYIKLLDLFKRNEMMYEWRFYKDGKAWLCKVQLKKRTIVWMSAWKGFMQATIYFPDRLIEKVYALEINAETKNKILSTKNVGKSKPCIFEIKDKTILKDFEKVMMLKIECK